MEIYETTQNAKRKIVDTAIIMEDDRIVIYTKVQTMIGCSELKPTEALTISVCVVGRWGLITILWAMIRCL